MSMPTKPSDPALRFRAWIHLLWLVPLGFALKAYPGPGAWWVNDYSAAVLYELFWIFAFFGLFCSRRAAFAVPLSVFVATSLLEVLQLSKAGLLQAARSHFLGRTLLGTTFDPWDFPVYLGSCALGWIWLRRLVHKSEILSAR